MAVAPLPVVLPLIIAAIMAATGNLVSRKALTVVGMLVSAVVTGICIYLAFRSSHGTIVYWFGRWNPQAQTHFPIGVCFAVGPIGAGMAALVSLLMLVAFTLSLSFYDFVKSFYHTLMLVFLAAMCGICLTGDIFNLFVWLELMTAAGVGLCGYESSESQPLLGALNFAVMNTIGAFVTLFGIALLYAMTGALNLAEISASLTARHPAPVFIAVAFSLVIAGFLVKAAAAPFHFWLADAHAVAPTPVCILFSGVMVQLGVYAIARLYFAVFSDSFAPHASSIRALFLLIGSVTAVIGAIHCFGQRHLKRLLALSTISHVGLMFIGLGLLGVDAIAGLAIYVIGHGLIKGALFICAAMFLHRFGGVDEFELRGRRVALPAILLLLGAMGLAGLPPFATFYGQSLLDHAAEQNHAQWLSLPMLVAEMLTAGAVLRFALRMYFGFGASREASSRGAPYIPMKSETGGTHSTIPATMWLPACVLLALAATLSLSPAARSAVWRSATHFRSSASYQAAVLNSTAAPDGDVSAAPDVQITWRQGASAMGAIACAGLALLAGHFGRDFEFRVAHFIRGIYKPLRRLQSGIIGDYVAWFVVGIAFYAGLLALLSH